LIVHPRENGAFADKKNSKKGRRNKNGEKDEKIQDSLQKHDGREFFIRLSSRNCEVLSAFDEKLD